MIWDAAEKGEIIVRDATCPAVHAALQASEKGVSFMPVPGIGASDLVTERKDWVRQGEVVLVHGERTARVFGRRGRDLQAPLVDLD